MKRLSRPERLRGRVRGVLTACLLPGVLALSSGSCTSSNEEPLPQRGGTSGRGVAAGAAGAASGKGGSAGITGNDAGRGGAGRGGAGTAGRAGSSVAAGEGGTPDTSTGGRGGGSGSGGAGTSGAGGGAGESSAGEGGEGGARCDASSCPDGCCNGGACESPSLATCGESGAACMACDVLRADGCSNGTCRCGANPACTGGLRCEAGTCACNVQTCGNGCCTAAGECISPVTAAACGVGGVLCVACDPIRADSCNSACSCGSAYPCNDGQHCVGGACVCDATSCPNGCCAGATCVPFAAQQTGMCGTNGAVCVACQSPQVCTNGACQ
jgi:hypothetical protein